MTSKTSKGIYIALITATISGFSIFLNKYAVASISPPLVFTALKNSGVGILILSMILLAGKWKLLWQLQRKQIIYLILIGIIGGSLPFYLFFTGLSQIPAINAALIQKTLVVWVTVLAVMVLKEKLSYLQIAAVVLLFCGNFFIGGFKSFTFSTGEYFVLGATLLWSIETVLAKKVLPTVDADIVVASRMGFGSLILMIASAVVAPAGLVKITSLTAVQWMWMSASVLLLFGYVTSWYRALKFAPASSVTAVLVSSTLVTNILSAVFVTHTWTGILALQAGLFVAGIGILWYASKREVNRAVDLVPAEVTDN